MYTNNERQVQFHDLHPEFFENFPVDSSNRWVKLSQEIPWVEIEEMYRQNFKNESSGELAKSARFALGSLIVKETFQLSDVETVQMIRENPYIQYFLGCDKYDYNLSLDSSSLTNFRKRFPADVMEKINGMIVEEQTKKDDDDFPPASGNGESGSDEELKQIENQGTLIIDATCAPQDIQYPTDVRLLHESRLKLEEMIDTLQPGRIGKKPRNYSCK